MTGEEKESRGEGGCLAGDEHENNGGDGRVEASVAHLQFNWTDRQHQMEPNTLQSSSLGIQDVNKHGGERLCLHKPDAPLMDFY